MSSYNSCNALSTLDNLIQGKPQRIIDGGVLLGLTSWHLYPDLVILGSKTQDVFQRDPLIAQSGVATLSIAYQEDPHGNQDGVYWSLSLASLRYYGVAHCERSSLRDSKLTMSEFQALILGASLQSLDTLSSAVDIVKGLWRQATGDDAIEDGLPSSYLSIDELLLAQAPKESKDFPLQNSMKNLHFLLPLIGGVDFLLSGTEGDQSPF
ncbi:hypothetical protein BJX70DRAFT_402042 [Aspergillus crustosus]